MKKIWRVLKLGLIAGLLVLGLILGVNFWVVHSTEDQVYYWMDNAPVTKVALILGTSKRTTEGEANKYFQERIETAAQLYHRKKVKHIIVSGDNRTVYYNEPRDMYNALVELEVPKHAITLDFAGLRTFDSIVRADSIFGQKQFTIVTQDFHCYRSLFIANYFGLEAIAYSAGGREPLHYTLAGREILARFLAVMDLYVWNKTPTILGEPERITLD